MNNFFLFFIVGLTTGGVACLAVQGGLLTSMVLNQKQPESNFSGGSLSKSTSLWSKIIAWLLHPYLLPIILFLLAKLVVHTIFGALLGWLGSTVAISTTVQLLFQIIVAGFMFATAMNLLSVHPMFRYVAIQPPRWIFRFIKKSSKNESFFAPLFLGALTVFIPCGVTQSIALMAMSAGSAPVGALTMSSFILGTMPLFILVGVATARLTHKWSKLFNKVAAGVLILLSLYTFNGVAIVLDSPFAIRAISRPLNHLFLTQHPSNDLIAPFEYGYQQVNINVLNQGYSPSLVAVKKGIPVKLTLRSKDAYSCALSFVLKEFGIKTFLKSTDEQSFVFTPQKVGDFTFTCSMGMYSGTFRVV